MGKEREGEGACSYITGEALSGGLRWRSWRPGRGLVGRAMASQSWGRACAALAFWKGAGGQRWRGGRAVSSSHVDS
jgi:hypothetical protein